MQRTFLKTAPYDLGMTLSSGQAFRWTQVGDGWESVLQDHWVRLKQEPGGIAVETMLPGLSASVVEHYLQTRADLEAVLASFPKDPAMERACQYCQGLRLLRQDPWECLASFILSSTKQIVQIRQIVDLLCLRFGDRVRVPPGRPDAYTFPSAARIAALTEEDLRGCKMGFRAPYLLQTARSVAGGVDLAGIDRLPLEEAREGLTQFPGVGRKIADCVLLFAYNHPSAFPVDVWVMKALRQIYFPKRKPTLKRLHAFIPRYFGPNAGYAQQYLFHHIRTSQP